MGCDIAYYLDHDFENMNAVGFLLEFKKRIKPLNVVFAGSDNTSYTDISKVNIQTGWMIYCYDEDYETAFSGGHCFSLYLYDRGKRRGWNITVNDKTLDLWIDDDELGFSPDRRWKSFTEKYRDNTDETIDDRISKTLQEIKDYILSVFHCTKMIATGDQGAYQEFELDMENGKTIDEALQNEKVNKDYNVKIYKHGSSEHFTYKDYQELPVWMCEFKRGKPRVDKTYTKRLSLL